MKTDLERLLSKCIKSADDGCWEWQAAKTKQGYGQFYFNGQMMGAHRASYWLHRGPVPSGLVIDHLCRNTSCINPSHLEIVTIKENILRGDNPVARNARKTHCKRGHLFDENNTLFNKRGGRSCKACIRDWDTTTEQREKRKLWAREYRKTDRWKVYVKGYRASKKPA